VSFLPITNYEKLLSELRTSPRTWLVTGVAGFIGSNLLEAVVNLDQHVVGLDNFSTGRQKNLDEVRAVEPNKAWARFRFIEGDLTDLSQCRSVCHGVDYVLHQGALGSVPRSMADPLSSHQSNVSGFLNMLVAARDAEVKRFVYASSSSAYGDDPDLPKVEDRIGRPLSPYAATKLMNELYAHVFAHVYDVPCIGLRYFNVFGPRQDPDGPYTAVIPTWIGSLLRRQPVHINGDGESSRDFCFVGNVVQANLLAATTNKPQALNQVYNVGVGERTSLNQLFQCIQRLLRRRDPLLPEQNPFTANFGRAMCATLWPISARRDNCSATPLPIALSPGWSWRWIGIARRRFTGLPSSRPV